MAVLPKEGNVGGQKVRVRANGGEDGQTGRTGTREVGPLGGVCLCRGRRPTRRGKGIIGRDESHSRHCSAHAGYLSYSLV
jgi:hypothetical protein